MEAAPASSHPAHLSRRSLLVGAAVGAAAIPFVGGAARAADGPIGRLPGEVARTSVVSRFGQPYEEVDVDIDGDLTRLFVPHTAVRKPATTLQAMLWYYHSNASTHTALSTAYKWNAEMALREGAICICPSYGGNTYVNDEAITRQKRVVKWVNNVFPIGLSFARANSGGAALMAFAYARNLLPRQRGFYSANGLLNLIETATKEEALGRTGVLGAYGGDWDKIRATNPVYLAGSVWTGKRMRFALSDGDLLCPPEYHGSRIVAKATGALERSVLWHDEGHVVPGSSHQDMIDTFRRWLNA